MVNIIINLTGTKDLKNVFIEKIVMINQNVNLDEVYNIFSVKNPYELTLYICVVIEDLWISEEALSKKAITVVEVVVAVNKVVVLYFEIT